ncbi:AAA family ATPase [Nitrincola sp. MINF-07-Sa-05]|uniref:AAA family ATPase n=1 Tax=Nitrincola salilacus TaxID=3400273 RepID=UPI003917E733
MIVRFGCSNYRSINKYQELLLTASSLHDEQSFLIDKPSSFNEKLLPCAGIYGANASGKTNILLAINYLVRAVVTSHRSNLEDQVVVNSFKLGSDDDRPSSFDIDFICADIHYHYGFTIGNDRFEEEWLFEYSYIQRKSRKILFHRKFNQEEEFYFGSTLKGHNKQLSDLTKENSLFLSVAANSNHEQLGKIYKFFKDSFHFRFSQNLVSEIIANEVKKTGTIDKLSQFMSKLETGISRLDIVSEEIPDFEKNIRKKLFSAFPAELVGNDEAFKKQQEQQTREVLRTVHISESGEEVVFPLEDESLGTRAAIALLAPLFDTLNNGGTFIIDEIESSLHPLLTLEAVKLFNDPSVNKMNAQLIFSTHETSVLCGGILRRDQIWLTEKDFSQGTVLTPLSDFRTRKTDNIRTGYLDGRFGAIPFFGDIITIIEDKESAQ